MIAVEVGDDDDVDRVAVDAGGLQIVVELAADALAALVVGFAGAGVHDHELGASLDDDRRVRDRHHVLFHVRGRECPVHRVLLGIEDEAIRQLEGVAAIGDGRDLEAADIVAVPARRLAAGERRCGGSGRTGQRRERGRGGSGGGAGQQSAAIEFGHWHFSLD